MTRSSFSNMRSRANSYIDSKLHGELQKGILKGFLELDVSEMNEPNITLCFGDARRLIEERGVALFTRQLNLIGQFTTIAACAATLGSLVNRESWPALALIGSMPFLNRLIAPLLFVFRGRRVPRISPQRFI